MADKVCELLGQGPVVINLGVKDFAESLKTQDVEVAHVEWTPPAGGNREMIELLDHLL
jgi:hypothetical protein